MARINFVKLALSDEDRAMGEYTRSLSDDDEDEERSSWLGRNWPYLAIPPGILAAKGLTMAATKGEHSNPISLLVQAIKKRNAEEG